MDRIAEQTVMCRTRLGEFSLVQFWRNGVYYAFPVCMETLQDVKLFVAATADDPNQNLTHEDELAIIDALHDLVFTPQWVEVEAQPAIKDSLIAQEPTDIRWLGFTLVASCIFWILLSSVLVIAFN